MSDNAVIAVFLICLTALIAFGMACCTFGG